MNQQQVDEFLRTDAPEDVQDTIAWLVSSGYVLVSQRGTNTFGAVFVFEGDLAVQLVVDRSQWWIDIATSSAAEFWQYDLLLTAQSGQEFGQRFPETGTSILYGPLPSQLPEDVNWLETLPGVLRWIQETDDVAELVAKAQKQRSATMWPRKRKRVRDE
ncbi:hypothetical protein ACIGB8_21190 [Promicromonospora sukumoe]|uniref:hypothetical protein n=1 Tax=Promicromonospora sukumoe TaxID=88382 RepID=UPI0037C7C489